MGCELGKLATPNQPTTDPRLPLTAKQKFTVMASWKAVSRKLETTGVFMLMRFVTCFNAFGSTGDYFNVYLNIILILH